MKLAILIGMGLLAISGGNPDRTDAAEPEAAVISPADSLFEAQIASPKKDAKTRKLKYYVFGIASPSKQYVDSMKQHFDIEVVSMGCVWQDYTCYNKYVASLMK